MLKIFDCVDPWPTKVNFVDSNNVVLGYDMNQQCCEEAEWGMEPPLTEEQLESYTFDTSFFHKGAEDDTGLAMFKLVSDGLPAVFIILCNTHNGHYSHGFEFTGPTGSIQSGSL